MIPAETIQSNKKVQLVVFKSGSLEFALDITAVQEVINYDQPTHVPLAPPDVAGLVNLRGLIITVIELDKFLKLNVDRDNAAIPDRKVIVLNTSLETFGIIVDEVLDVNYYDLSNLNGTPSTLYPSIQSVVDGILLTGSEVILKLSHERLRTYEGQSI